MKVLSYVIFMSSLFINRIMKGLSYVIFMSSLFINRIMKVLIGAEEGNVRKMASEEVLCSGHQKLEATPNFLSRTDFKKMVPEEGCVKGTKR